MQDKKKGFSRFHDLFPYLDIKEQIENYAVFDGMELGGIELKESVFDNIETYIIKRYKELKSLFAQDDELDMLLQKVALGDRKQYAIYRSNKNLSQQRGKALYKELYQKGIIKKELTREKLPQKSKHKLLKKELRGYKAEDKIRFVKNFDRFWHTFISPFYEQLDVNQTKECLENIEKNLDKYVSFCFEELSNELIKQRVFALDIIESGGYWDKNSEFDLLAKMKDGGYIIGECKWTNQRVSKNILRKLYSKAQSLDFRIEKYALFSKNGFSNSLKKEKDVMLFDLKDFGVLNDR